MSGGVSCNLYPQFGLSSDTCVPTYELINTEVGNLIAMNYHYLDDRAILSLSVGLKSQSEIAVQSHGPIQKAEILVPVEPTLTPKR